ncbi:hypothetical protein [Pyxidicoccus caerfyrddinensis]|uniref:hypothetical protein n=1 Tax=Pyxidicoccus caerfyrddinensis TaxID=2709663 RepID=UPI0013D9A15A|nr:hypothetical protein [Pyxidicoccus caerfyrddinensis]
MSVAVTRLPELKPTNSYEVVDPPLAHPRLREIAQDILNEFKASVFRVGLGMSLPTERTSWEQLVRERMERAPAEVRARVSQRLKNVYDNPQLRARELGRFAELDLTHPSVLLNVQPPRAQRAALRQLAQLFKAQGSLAFHPEVQLERASGTDLRPQDYLHTRVRFMLDKVYCVDETWLDWPGSDEIGMGGFSVDETGEVEKIAAFTVSNDFDTGETRDFKPDKSVRTFSVKEGGENWPKVYRVTLAMVERDWGDFPGWVTSLYEKVKGRLKEYLATAAAGVGGAIGGPLGALVGAVAGWVVGWIVDNIIGWIKSWWEDDLIATKTFTLTHAGPRATFSGQARSPVAKRSWIGGTGEYNTFSYWELLK